MTRASFHQFTLLPTELRLNIWEFTALFPREVVLLPAKDSYGNRCATPPPSILHVCHESQTVALSHYKKVHNTVDHYFHINFDVDTLQVLYSLLVECFYSIYSGFFALRQAIRDDVKHLRVFMHREVYVPRLADQIRAGFFPRLETLDLAVPTLHNMISRDLSYYIKFGSERVAIRIIHSSTREYINNETMQAYLEWRYKVDNHPAWVYDPDGLSAAEQAACPSQFLGEEADPFDGRFETEYYK